MRRLLQPAKRNSTLIREEDVKEVSQRAEAEEVPPRWDPQ